MLRMLIADDERAIREAINQIIDWHSLGIEVIGLCKNGIEAYDMILDEYPDIVLTDINMPGLSGLELIRRIIQVSKDTEFVILSGYGDYKYTKEAMKLGIQFYLLKPCSEAEIIEVMQSVKKVCLHKRVQREQEQEGYLMLRCLHESVIRNLIVSSMTEHPNYEAMRVKYERFLDFDHVGYEVCAVHCAKEETVEKGIRAFREYHNAHAAKIPAYCLQCGDILYLAFESYDYDYQLLDKYMEEVCGRQNYHHDSFQSLNGLLPCLHKTMQENKSKRISVGFERQCLHQADPESEVKPIEADAGDDFVGKILEIIEQNISNPELSLKNISEKYLYMNVDYVSKKFIKTTGKKFSAVLAEARIGKAKKMFASDASISVNEVADAVGCGNNPQYFSQLFKKVEGMPPTAYIKQITE